uniref:Membrin-11-like n=2 Tax=Nicotiana TaxID=4085 RepID=A0A1S3WYT1_TOBAC|nr:PREDICTED: membrin-11-like [Nicotiana sylvestris]XP_016432875.1 PREDICTED: membrin-11-like [Nicotiana tabacum]
MAMAVEVAGGGGTLSEFYQSSRRLLLKTRDGLERLERFEYTSFSSSSSSSSSVLSSGAAVSDPSEKSVDGLRKDISQIQSLCSEMERLWRSIPAKSQRDLWKRKVEQVAEEVDSLKDSLFLSANAFLRCLYFVSLGMILVLRLF